MVPPREARALLAAAAVLPAMVELRIVSVLVSFRITPTPLGAVLAVMVVFEIDDPGPLVKIAAPPDGAELPVMALRVRLRTALEADMPPPGLPEVSVLPLTVLSETLRTPAEAETPAPDPPVLAVETIRLSVRVPPLERMPAPPAFPAPSDRRL